MKILASVTILLMAGCCKSSNYKFVIEGMEVQAVKIHSIQNQLGSVNYRANTQTQTILSRDSAGIRIHCQNRFIAGSAISLPFVSSAFACDPISPHSDEIVDSFAVYSEPSWNDSIHSQQNIANLFDLYEIEEPNTVNFPQNAFSYMAGKPKARRNYLLQLKEKTMNSQKRVFRIECRINGKWFQVKSDSVQIL